MKSRDIIELFEKCREEGKSAWSEIHGDYKDDKDFIQFGRQLVDDHGDPLKLKGRPAFVINKLIQYVKDVSNDMRQTSMASKVYPIDGGADVDKASARAGVVRGIERASKAKLVYAYGGEEMVTGGMGAWRVDIVPVSDKSFDKTMKIRRIMNAASVMYGPCVEPDYSDAPWCIVEEPSSPAKVGSVEYRKLKDDEVKHTIWGTVSNPVEYEFWYRHETPDTLLRFKTGKNVFKSQIKPDTPDDLFVFRDGKRLEERRTRKQWKCYKLKAKTITNKGETDWPGKYCPIVVTQGREVVNEGCKRKLLSLCRYSKDSQRLYNYARQEMGRILAMAPKATWLAALRAIPKAFRKMWDTAHENTWGTLYYNDMDESGNPIAPPTAIQRPPLDPNLSQETQITDAELKDTTGIQAENLAQRSNAVSGKAILAKQAEGNNAAFDYQVGLATGVEYTQRVILDLIPKVIDTQRQIRIVGEDDAEKVVVANQEYTEKKTGEVKNDYYFNEEEEYDLGVSIGPSYESKRNETSEKLLELMKISEIAAAKLPFMYVKNLDFDGADEASRLLKPPELADSDEDDGPPLPPEVAQQLQMIPQMQQVIQQQGEELKRLQDSQEVEKAKILQKQMSDQRKLDIEQQKANTDKFSAIVQALQAEQQVMSRKVEQMSSTVSKMATSAPKSDAKNRVNGNL